MQRVINAGEFDHIFLLVGQGRWIGLASTKVRERTGVFSPFLVAGADSGDVLTSLGCDPFQGFRVEFGPDDSV